MSHQTLTCLIRDALGAYNDPGRPLAELIHDLVARLEALEAMVGGEEGGRGGVNA